MTRKSACSGSISGNGQGGPFRMNTSECLSRKTARAPVQGCTGIFDDWKSLKMGGIRKSHFSDSVSGNGQDGRFRMNNG